MGYQMLTTPVDTLASVGYHAIALDLHALSAALAWAPLCVVILAATAMVAAAWVDERPVAIEPHETSDASQRLTAWIEAQRSAAMISATAVVETPGYPSRVTVRDRAMVAYIEGLQRAGLDRRRIAMLRRGWVAG